MILPSPLNILKCTVQPRIIFHLSFKLNPYTQTLFPKNPIFLVQFNLRNAPPQNPISLLQLISKCTSPKSNFIFLLQLIPKCTSPKIPFASYSRKILSTMDVCSHLNFTCQVAWQRHPSKRRRRWKISKGASEIRQRDCDRFTVPCNQTQLRKMK